MKKKKSPWANNGGARPGAGGKPQGDQARVKMSLTLSVDVAEYVRQADGNLSEIAESAIRRSKAFKDWKKGKKIKMTGVSRHRPSL